jgi:hypothetical protein
MCRSTADSRYLIKRNEQCIIISVIGITHVVEFYSNVFHIRVVRDACHGNVPYRGMEGLTISPAIRSILTSMTLI